MITSFYPGLDYPAEQILKVLSAIDFFTILLKDGNIIHFTPESSNNFKEWLSHHHINDMRSDEEWKVKKQSNDK